MAQWQQTLKGFVGFGCLVMNGQSVVTMPQT